MYYFYSVFMCSPSARNDVDVPLPRTCVLWAEPLLNGCTIRYLSDVWAHQVASKSCCRYKYSITQQVPPENGFLGSGLGQGTIFD